MAFKFWKGFNLMEFYYLVGLLLLNFLLKIKTLYSPLDNDTSNHIYIAKQLYKRKNLFHSYIFGVKYSLVKLYTLFASVLSKNVYYFRFLALISSSIIIILTYSFFDISSDIKLLFFVLFILILNSHWVYYTTSASEFHEAVFLVILIISMTVNLDINFYIIFFVQLLCILVLVSFKIINILYLGIVLLNFYEKNGISIFLIIISIVLIFLVFKLFKYYKNNATSSVNKYKSSRSVFNAKNIRYFFLNIHFVLFIASLTSYNVFYSNYILSCMIITAWLIFIIQKNYTTYFYYPLVVINFVIALSFNLPNIEYNWVYYAVLFVLLGHTLLFILIPNSRWSDILNRMFFMGNFGWKKYLDNREKQLIAIKKYINDKDLVYMWGSNIALLVLSDINHVEETYFSHNHLLLWSALKNEEEYVENLIREIKPKFIIESECVKNFTFNQKLCDMYNEVFNSNNMKIYLLNIDN